MPSVGVYNADREYFVLAYETVSGQVVRELPLAAEPTWDARLNDVGGGTVACPLGVSSDWDNWLHEIARPYRYSLAVGLSGTQLEQPMLQAGPMIAYVPDETVPDSGVAKIQFAFRGIWEMFNRRLLHHRDWNPAVNPITGSSADLTINDNLSNIARTVMDHTTSMTYRLGSGLPLDLPAPVGGPDGNTRTYHGFDMISSGQRLQELTQVDAGPDLYFQPYLTSSGGRRVIRHKAVIGNPYIVQPGVSLRFDYKSNLTKVAVNGAGDDTSTTAFVKGTGNESAQQYGYATDSSLIAVGWPLLDFVDNSHTSTLIQGTLDGWARADVALLSDLPEQWKSTVLTESNPRLGEYIPGHFVSYNILDHHWIPDGLYTWRLLSLARPGTGQAGTVEQVIQALGAY